MKVDYYLPPVLFPAAAEAARRAERLGFDGFFTAETTHDPFLPLAVAAVETERLDLGTAIAVAFPRSPMVVAQTSWDLAAASQGRFILGLGTQVRAHITRRFSTTWDSPGPRLRDYILSLRAIWHSFQTGEPLRYEGDFYRFSLLTPFFNPGPIPHPDVPIAIAGVNPYLCRLAGELCQGFHVHPFHTVDYLDQVVLPAIREGAEAAGRDPGEVELITTVFVVTGRNRDEMDQMREAVRNQIAFYASTPSYRIVLDTHGWGEIGDRLNALSRRGEWEEMTRLVPDEMVEAAAVIAPPDELGEAIKNRYDGRVQRVGYYLMMGEGIFDDDLWERVVASTK
ncbi:MAG: LLM class F420-dependent oxidoreductase [Acidimicrobiia bacterium]|nr:MAG: LLM class F420-dependent oxidoreductase [Acidimicrobiia bacterium]